MQINGFQVLVSGGYNAFLEGFNTAGSYAISGLIPSNTFKVPLYIGGTEDAQRRNEKEHFPELKNNIHINKPLQNYYNKHGIENIVVLLLEISKPEDCFDVEQKYLDLYRPFVDEFGGFNICHEARGGGARHTEESKEKIRQSSMGEKNHFFGKKHSEESKRKMSESLTGRILSEETKKKMSESTKGFKHSKETCDKISKIHKGKIIPQEQIERQRQKILGKKATEETKIKLSLSHKGKMENALKHLMKTYSLKSPSGEVITFTGVKKFCRENNLISGCIFKVLHNKQTHHKGWTLPDKPEE